MLNPVNLEGKLDVANGSTLNISWKGGRLTVLKTDAMKETTTITCNAADTLSGGEYFTINGTAGEDYYVWFEVEGVGNDPRVANRTGVKITLAELDLNTDVASEVARRLNEATTLNASVTTNVVTVITSYPANIENAADQDTGFTISVTQEGQDPDVYDGIPFKDVRQILDIDIADDGSAKLTVEVERKIIKPKQPVSWTTKEVQYAREYRTLDAGFFSV